MIRNFLVSILFFFGPVILMFVLRNLGLFLRLWLSMRRRQRQEAEVIDITPVSDNGPSVLFIIAAIMIGLVCATLAWLRVGGEGIDDRQYAPAYMDERGVVVPGKIIPADKN
ncbi:MAG: hypothetical protein ACE5F3_04785 [Mariprofundaceae bacterium]